MKKLISKLSPVQWLALALIIIGVAIMIPKAKGLLDFYKEAQYAIQNRFHEGNVSPDLMRPWMSIRYVSVAYGVPQKYLFDAAGIQQKKENSMMGLNRLNQQMGLGQVDGQPALMKTIGAAILAYRANPIATGLIEQRVESWMTVAYIANCIGIPAETILQSVGIAPDGNAYELLGNLSDKVNYAGGEKALIAAIQKIVDEKGVKPVMP